MAHALSLIKKVSLKSFQINKLTLFFKPTKSYLLPKFQFLSINEKCLFLKMTLYRLFSLSSPL